MLAAFRYTLRRFLHFSEQAAEVVGLTPHQHQALLAVRGGGGPMTVGDLAERLQVRHHSAVGLVDRLVRGGLLSRRPSPVDGRAVRLHLTARGSRLLERLTAAHRRELSRIRVDLVEPLDHLGQ
jgi:DNA-binding MarR family transcriptional regulator